MVILLYCFSIINTNKLVKTAHENEVNALKKEQRNVKLMVSQTVEALAEAIDAKDRCTNGIPNAIINIIIMNEFVKGAGRNLTLFSLKS